MVEDDFMRELLVKGYQVPSRSDIDTVLKELRLQHSDITDQNAAEIGKILNVPAILIISITQYEKYKYQTDPFSSPQDFARLTLGARLIDVEKSEVLWVGSIFGDAQTMYYDSVLKQCSQKLAESVPGRFGVENRNSE